MPPLDQRQILPLHSCRATRCLPAAGTTVLLVAVALWLLCATGSPRAEESAPTPLSLSDVFTSASAQALPPAATPQPAHEESDRPLTEAETLTLLDQADALLREGRKAAARNLVQQVAARTPPDSSAAPRASLFLARLANSPEAALSPLEAISVAGPVEAVKTDARPHPMAAGAADNASLAAEATRVALAWFVRAENDPDKANTPGTQRLLDLAIKLARQSHDPALIEESLWTRARFLARTGRPDKAYQLLAEARKSETVSQPGPLWLALEGETALATRKLPEAQAAFEELVDRFPQRPEAIEILGRLGLLLELGGQPDTALRCYSRYAHGGSNLRDSIWVERRARALATLYFPPPTSGGVK